MDLHHAACALQGFPREQRVDLCALLIWRAHVADKYVKRLAKLHPQWGDGSLRAAALGHRIGIVTRTDCPEFLRCLSIVVNAVVAKQTLGMQS